MSMTLIRKLRAERDALKHDTVEPVLARMEAGEDLTDADRSALATADTEVQRLDAQIESLTQMAARALDAAARDAELDRKSETLAQLDPRLPAPDSVRETFASAATDRIIGLGGSGTITVPRAALSVIDNRDAAGTHIAGVVRVRPAPEPVTITPLLDATAKQPVTTDDYEWESWGLIPVAGVVAAAEGSVKPEATDGYELVKGLLSTVAHHIGVSRRALEDRPGLEAKIANRLLRGVDLRAEQLAVTALTGGTFNAATHDDGLLQAIRVAMAMVQDQGFDPSTLVINPLDQADIDIDLLKLAQSGAVRGASTWGVQRIVATGKVPRGTAYVGSIFDALLTTYRSDAMIFATDSHADEFVRNRIRLLAEQRISVDLQQPNAVVTATTATPAP
jgi:HK97 family phage major capsid protein